LGWMGSFSLAAGSEMAGSGTVTASGLVDVDLMLNGAALLNLVPFGRAMLSSRNLAAAEMSWAGNETSLPRKAGIARWASFSTPVSFKVEMFFVAGSYTRMTWLLASAIYILPLTKVRPLGSLRWAVEAWPSVRPRVPVPI